MTAPTCPRDRRPMPDTAYVCSTCADHLTADLTRAAGNAGELEAAVAKQVRLGDPARGSGEPPLPFDWDAADARFTIVNTLTSWTRLVAEERGKIATGNMALWLAGQTGWLRYHPDAETAFDELDYACRLLERTIDRPAQRVFVGQCACGGYLYARANSATVACPQCDTAYDTAAAKAQLMEDISGMLFTAAELATLAGFFLPEQRNRRDRVRNLINQWASRAVIVAHGHIPLVVKGEIVDVPTYPLGDTIRRVASAHTKAS